MANRTGKGQFKKGADPRRNNAGQRNKAAVETQAQLRALYVAVLREAINTPMPDPSDMSNLEFIARQHIRGAKSGVKDDRETMFDRLWGKIAQSVEVGNKDGEEFIVVVREEAAKADANR